MTITAASFARRALKQSETIAIGIASIEPRWRVAKRLPRRQFRHLAAGAAALRTLARIARAQAYPARPVRLIVSNAAGGAQDTLARLMGQWLSEPLGHPFVIENRQAPAPISGPRWSCVLLRTAIRLLVFREVARVLKPGGRVVLVDSLQRGDQPDYDGLLELFPQNFHEPYYKSYVEEDFSDIARACGLRHTRSANAFVSKVMVFDKL